MPVMAHSAVGVSLSQVRVLREDPELEPGALELCRCGLTRRIAHKAELHAPISMRHMWTRRMSFLLFCFFDVAHVVCGAA